VQPLVPPQETLDPGAKIDEGAIETWLDTPHPPAIDAVDQRGPVDPFDSQFDQPAPLVNQGDPGFTRRDLGKNIDGVRRHDRSPMPCSSCAVSKSGNPTTLE
jgi:hypothetical protein